MSLKIFHQLRVLDTDCPETLRLSGLPSLLLVCAQDKIGTDEYFLNLLLLDEFPETTVGNLLLTWGEKIHLKQHNEQKSAYQIPDRKMDSGLHRIPPSEENS